MTAMNVSLSKVQALIKSIESENAEIKLKMSPEYHRQLSLDETKALTYILLDNYDKLKTLNDIKEDLEHLNQGGQ